MGDSERSNAQKILEGFFSQNNAESKVEEEIEKPNPQEDETRKLEEVNEKRLALTREIADEIIKAVKGEARKIVKRELKEIGGNVIHTEKGPKKGNERVICIRKGAWPSVQKFKRTSDESLKVTFYRILEAALRYLEQGGSLDSLENQTNHHQKSNNNKEGLRH